MKRPILRNTNGVKTTFFKQENSILFFLLKCLLSDSVKK